ncbi:MAG: response regulator [Saprospiraceae bacterium]|nr:response regulator [Saprospiraceae bacterium]MCB0543032.1 response regulator [Saprospiraceae bacterium]MCB0576055.1 response regulator [Saprospiraceae bacterium]MCB9305361.1 response regulator [Lewinellaceae bacterium]MCB9355998.1 response regulator [Lewinellaceae bacterium]
MNATYRILVVDDEDDVEQLIRQKFRRQVREGEYEFVFAKNGVDALTRLKEHADIDIVFSDINMPEMDGLTLLEKITERSPLLKTVIISAYGDMQNIRTAMNRGAFDFICKPFDFEDFERTLKKTLAFATQIRETLGAIRENNILKMYVDNSVLQFMNSQEYERSLLASETVDATIAFVDICGFTSISEREPPDLVVRLLNKYFDIIVEAIIAEGGYVDKFMGDAVLAVFRDQDHLPRALRAALAVNTRIQAIEDTLSDGQPFLPRVSIGINAGDVISGNVGAAALRRFDFTVIGDVVNTAQRLQSAARPGQILVNEETQKKAGGKFRFQKIGDVAMKNKARPVTVYELLE